MTDEPFRTIPKDLPDADHLIALTEQLIANEQGSLLPLHDLLKVLVAYERTRLTIEYLRDNAKEINRLSDLIMDTMESMNCPRVSL